MPEPACHVTADGEIVCSCRDSKRCPETAYARAAQSALAGTGRTRDAQVIDRMFGRKGKGVLTKVPGSFDRGYYTWEELQSAG